jgi:3-methyladenine DNA glycosylase AlkD
MNLFDKSPLAWKKIPEWSQREQEFIRRAALALIACLAWHDKRAENRDFLELMPVIRSCATDERNYVKKAASWALRNIGKRNRNLNQAAIQSAVEIQAINSKAARWIAADVLHDLKSEAVQKRLQ